MSRIRLSTTVKPVFVSAKLVVWIGTQNQNIWTHPSSNHTVITRIESSMCNFPSQQPQRYGCCRQGHPKHRYCDEGSLRCCFHRKNDCHLITAATTINSNNCIKIRLG